MEPVWQPVTFKVRANLHAQPAKLCRVRFWVLRDQDTEVDRLNCDLWKLTVLTSLCPQCHWPLTTHLYAHISTHTVSVTRLQQYHVDVPIPSVRRVCTLSSAGMSSNHLSQGGIPTPLLRTLPSSCTCVMIVSSHEHKCSRNVLLVRGSSASRKLWSQTLPNEHPWQ